MPLDHSIIRISKEIGDIQKTSDLSLAVACRDVDVRNVRALITGPHETPYEFGFFEFSVRFPSQYPSGPPNVVSLTTNRGRCRFNPNIYANGKVCLSILGTWRGERGEEWSSAQGLESILLSIQSLMSSNPYENEPGFEDAKSESDKRAQKAYAQKIQHETLRLSVIQRLEGYLRIDPDGSTIKTGDGCPIDPDDVDESSVPFEPFQDLCKRKFLWYYESYLAAIEKGKTEVKMDQAFERMPFEHVGSNSMDGKFIYDQLEKRLRNVKAAIGKETLGWAQQGMEHKMRESTIATNLKHQYEQVTAHLKQGQVPNDLALEDGNPFIWVLTYFGRPTTSLDGGLCRIKIRFSPRFPDEQPRAIVETRIFHHLVAPDGTVCYTPRPERKDDVRGHIEAILATLEEDDPAYDPRKLVHPEASQLFWNGGKEGRKQYRRRLRRSVEQSMEEFIE